MGQDTISEEAFLLTELQYTLGQLHVQVLDLDQEVRREPIGEQNRSVDDILAAMIDAEKRYQGQYMQLLHTSGTPQTDDIPLPVEANEEVPSRENTFEHLRAETIEMLKAGGANWTPALLEMVRQQVADDRRATTEIAEARTAYYEQEQRPDLNEPLTAPQ